MIIFSKFTHLIKKFRRRLKGFYSNYFGKKYFPSHYNQCPQKRIWGGGGEAIIFEKKRVKEWLEKFKDSLVHIYGQKRTKLF